MILDPIAIAALLLATIATARAFYVQRGLSLTEIALRAIAIAQRHATNETDLRRYAYHAGQRLDAADNGKRDFSDAQIALAVDAELVKRGQQLRP